MFQSSLLSFSLFYSFFLLSIFSRTLSSSSLLFLSSFLFFFLSFLPSIPTPSLPPYLPALSAHSSATIEAIEAIEVKDAEGKTLTHLTVCACTRVYVYTRVRACVRVCMQHGCTLSRPCSQGHIILLTHDAPSSSSSSSHHTSLKPPHGHQHRHTSSLSARAQPT